MTDKIDDRIDMIMTACDSMLRAGHFADVADYLAKVDIEDDIEVLVAYLVAVNAVRWVDPDEWPAIFKPYERIALAIKDRCDEPGLLDGLYP